MVHSERRRAPTFGADLSLEWETGEKVQLAGGGYLVVYKFERDKLAELARIMIWIF
jgi:hypothetical protein